MAVPRTGAKAVPSVAPAFAQCQNYSNCSYDISLSLTHGRRDVATHIWYRTLATSMWPCTTKRAMNAGDRSGCWAIGAGGCGTHGN